MRPHRLTLPVTTAPTVARGAPRHAPAGRERKEDAMVAWFGPRVSIAALALVMVACAAGAPAAARSGAAPAAPGGAPAPAAQAPAAPAPPTEPLPLVTLKMAGQPALPAAPRYIAIERGYLREE